MKVQEFTDKQESKIVAAMVVSSQVLGKVTGVWHSGMARSPMANLVIPLLTRYFRKYGKAPGWRNAEPLFLAWASKAADKDAVAALDVYLVQVREQDLGVARGLNAEYWADLAGDFFTEVRLIRHLDKTKGFLDGGRMDEALKEVAAFSKVEMRKGGPINLLHDEIEIKTTFDRRSENLVVYPDGLGEFFQDQLGRDCFVAFTAREKAGKSWWLADLAWRAMQQRRRVIFFEVGDMSKNQAKKRFLTRAAQWPARSPTRKWPCTLRYPVALPNKELVEFQDLTFDAPLSAERAHAAAQQVIQTQLKSNKPYFYLSCHANSSINVAGLNSILDDLEREDWLADLICVDYSDILAPPAGIKEPREQINETWKQLRRMSQDRHCLVATATQANRASYGVNTLRMEHISEDKRKLAHTTGVVGINATDAEKAMGLCRLNWVVLREAEFVTERCVHVASCLALANPAVLSIF